MSFNPLRRVLCTLLGPILEMDDTDIFHVHTATTSAPDDTWLGIPQPPPPRETGHPEIGGTQITYEWLKSLPSRDCLFRFRFYADEMADLVRILDIPRIWKTQSRGLFTGIEALGLLLARFRSARDQYDLLMKYNRCRTSISEIVNELAIYLSERWGHLLDFDTNGILSPVRMQEYARAIYNAGAPLDSIYAFIDCTIRHICRPMLWQQVAYNGHKKIHANKFQALVLPNGLFGHLFGPMEGRRNDNALLAASEHRHNEALLIFGDPAYSISPLIMSPFAGAGERSAEETAWNAAMSVVCIEVEHGFSNVVKLWPFMDAWWKQRLYSSPIGHYYRVSVLLTNALNCIRPNQTSQYFDLLPPELEEYFTTK
ncbi:DDE Tnp4 domain-containing protein [Mycena venus]|uniref:DDE Tnp4 domain-containing protein n=1 Tax=Mycena venus TaxID=2733690 RepID=A0A8H6YDU5_9AGAR|nr:DDE Tnp4 domain-containing protein [Mycena venus]